MLTARHSVAQEGPRRKELLDHKEGWVYVLLSLLGMVRKTAGTGSLFSIIR